MSAERVVIAHLSDLHFGGYADLAQIEALEAFLPTLGLRWFSTRCPAVPKGFAS